MRRWPTAVLPVLAAALTSCHSTDSELRYPARPIKVVVPFAAGGGSDTFARIIKRAIDDGNLLEQPLVILNVDGYTLLNVHEALITAKHSGKVVYGPEAFVPIAGTGEVGLAVAVAEDSQYRDLTQLVAAAQEKPDSVVFSANLGAPSHFVGLRENRENRENRGRSPIEEPSRSAVPG